MVTETFEMRLCAIRRPSNGLWFQRYGETISDGPQVWVKDFADAKHFLKPAQAEEFVRGWRRIGKTDFKIVSVPVSVSFTNIHPNCKL